MWIRVFGELFTCYIYIYRWSCELCDLMMKIKYCLFWLCLMWSQPPVVVRLTAYLFVWMGRRRAGLIFLFACSVSCLRIAGATSVYQLESYIRLWLGVSLYDFWICLCCGDFAHMSGFWILYFMDVFMSWWHGYLRCMLYFRCDVLLLKFFACLFGEFMEDSRLFLEYLLYSRDLSL